MILERKNFKFAAKFFFSTKPFSAFYIYKDIYYRVFLYVLGEKYIITSSAIYTRRSRRAIICHLVAINLETVAKMRFPRKKMWYPIRIAHFKSTRQLIKENIKL